MVSALCFQSILADSNRHWLHQNLDPKSQMWLCNVQAGGNINLTVSRYWTLSLLCGHFLIYDIINQQNVLWQLSSCVTVACYSILTEVCFVMVECFLCACFSQWMASSYYHNPIFFLIQFCLRVRLCFYSWQCD